MNTDIPDAIAFYQNILSIRRIENNLVVPDSMTNCGTGYAVMDEHKGNGVENCDLLIYVYSEASPDNEYWSARAGACLRDGDAGDVPFIGKVIVNKTRYDSTNYNSNHAIMIHELAHVLAISSDNFSRYKVFDPNTLTYSNYPSPTTTDTMTVRGRNHSALLTPKAL